MKKILLTVLILAALLSFAACAKDSQSGNQNINDGNSGSNGENNNDNTQNDPINPGIAVPENTIFGYGISPSIIFNPIGETITEPAMNKLLQSMFALCPSVNDDTVGELEHEIVLGNTSRDVTKAALLELEKLIDKEADSFAEKYDSREDITGYVIYSNGSSVAVVWKDLYVAPTAIEYFAENYTDTRELILEPGVIASGFLSISKYLGKHEEELLAEKWAALANAIPAEYSEGIVTELKRLYDLYDERMVVWLANLYEPAVGGWYHSNSARDDLNGFSIGTKQVQYLPDIENTYVALSFVAATGMAEMFGGDWAAAMPDWLLADVGAWVQSLQDPDGFFYHPQWPKEYIESKNLQSRITRDRGSAKELLRRTGYSVMYTSYTPSDGTLTDRLSDKNTVVAVSKVVASAAMLWQYESNENFKEYLAGFDAELATMTDSQRAWQFYYYGNLFQSTTSYMTPEMKAMTIEFFDKYQNPENGMWSEGLYYDSTNGIHKIAAVYNNIGVEMKYIDKIVESTMEIINFDFETKPASGGVNIYNAWSCFPYLYRNIRNYASASSYDERQAKCDEIKMKVFAMAEDAIHNTYVHTVGMQQEDGSFGYGRNGSSSTAQGCPAAVPGSREGDVNGNALTSYDIVHYITLALELEKYEIPMFTEADRYLFVSILEEKREKLRMEVGEDKLYTFESVTIGTVPKEFKVSIDAGKNEISDSKIEVVKQDNGNRALSFTMRHRGDDNLGRNYNLQVPVTAISEYSNVSKLSFSIMILSSTVEASNVCEITIGRASDGACVILPRLGVAGGIVSIYDTKGEKIADIGRVDEFIDLEIVYRFGEKAYDVYVDGVLKGTAYATYNSHKHEIPAKVTIGSASTTVADYLIDNIRFVNYK